jgi:hypothetical protein
MTEPLSSIGVGKILALIGGAIGAALGVAISSPISKKRAWVCVLTGIILGGSVAPIAGWYFNVPPDLWGYVACIVGIPGIGLANAITKILSDPLGALSKYRSGK